MSMSADQLKIFKEDQGVYFLFLDKKVIYIGQSKDVYDRLIYHRIHSEFDFDFAFCVQGTWSDDDISFVLFMEMVFICYYQPKYNKIKFPSFTYWFLSLPNHNGIDTDTLYSRMKPYNDMVEYTDRWLVQKGKLKPKSNEKD